MYFDIKIDFENVMLKTIPAILFQVAHDLYLTIKNIFRRRNSIKARRNGKSMRFSSIVSRYN